LGLRKGKGNMAYVIISSVQFPGAYLRMDGTGVPARLNSRGTVNCQYGASAWETFQIQWVEGGINVASVSFPGLYLRMDGTGVTAPTASGGGTVNCQYGASAWETFTLEWQPDGTVAIASVQFPGLYLRMDGTGVTAPTGSGGGTVNCQYGASAWETFRFTGVPTQLPELEMVPVPKIVGMDYPQASQALSAEGLILHYSTYMEDVCLFPGQIHQQSPSTGSKVAKGSTVNGMACVPTILTTPLPGP
jgi:hypothetical protein